MKAGRREGVVKKSEPRPMGKSKLSICDTGRVPESVERVQRDPPRIFRPRIDISPTEQRRRGTRGKEKEGRAIKPRMYIRLRRKERESGCRVEADRNDHKCRRRWDKWIREERGGVAK